MSTSYFIKPEHIYVSYYNDELIVLDLIKDQYLVLPYNSALALEFILQHGFTLNNNHYTIISTNATVPEDLDQHINTLLEKGIIISAKTTQTFPQALTHKPTLAGASNIDWRLEYDSLHQKVSFTQILHAYWMLLKVHWILKFKGFHALIKAIKQPIKKPDDYTTQNKNAFSSLVTALNHACYFYPIKIECLRWSATLVLLALKRKWRCNLVIGVQNYPFAAHAWVETAGQVIADNPKLPKDLAVILREPFKETP